MSRIDSEDYSQKILQLQAAIKYEEENYPATKNLVDQCLQDDPDTIINYACIAYKEGRFEEARKKFSDALNVLGYQSDLKYNVALCHYKMKQYSPALENIADIIEVCTAFDSLAYVKIHLKVCHVACRKEFVNILSSRWVPTRMEITLGLLGTRQY